MKQASIDRVIRFTWPEGVVTLAALGVLAFPRARAAATPFLAVFPYVVLTAGVVLGLRFSRGRLLAALLSLVVIQVTLDRLGTRGSAIAVQSMAILLPLNLVALALLPEITPLRRFGTYWLGVVGIQAVAIAALARSAPPSVAYGLGLPIFPIPFLERAPIPQAAQIAFVIAIVLLALRVAAHRDPAARGLLWATVAALVAFNFTAQNRTLYLGVAGLALTVAMLEASYALAFHDDLTGLPARRAFNQALAELEDRYVVAMVDVDHFKQFNDRYGHDVGDQVLKLVANRLGAIEGGGKAFRYGGEEFAVLFPDVSLAAATPHLEELRKNIEATTFTLRSKNRPKKPDPAKRGTSKRSKDISVTVSVGAAEAGSRTKQPSSVVKAADEALYQAKGDGRNRVVAAGVS